MLKPQDVVIILKIIVKLHPEKTSPWLPLPIYEGNGFNRIVSWNFASLADELCMSSSEVHAGFKRAVKSQLIYQKTRDPNMGAILEFLIHGLKYAFPVEIGEITRGVPTAHAVAPLKLQLIDNNETVPVWPYSEGSVRGQSFKPLYKSVPQAALKDPLLYELLALVDAIRGGRTRERNLAIKELQKRLGVKENANVSK